MVPPDSGADGAIAFRSVHLSPASVAACPPLALTQDQKYIYHIIFYERGMHMEYGGTSSRQRKNNGGGGRGSCFSLRGTSHQTHTQQSTQHTTAGQRDTLYIYMYAAAKPHSAAKL